MTINGITAKRISNFEDVYAVTIHGEVYRWQKSYDRWKKIGFQDVKGYIQVRLTYRRSGTNKHRTVQVHTLVAETFIDNPLNCTMVDHVDENKTNNFVDNLRWCTPRENSDYYHNQQGRKYYLDLIKNQKKNLKLKTIEEQEKRQNIFNEIKDAKKELSRIESKIKEAKKTLENIILEINHKRKIVDTIGKKYSSVNDMIQSTGIPVKINGQFFPSAGSAASFICESEPTKNKDTVSRQIRKIVSGKTQQNIMYGKYRIEPTRTEGTKQKK